MRCVASWRLRSVEATLAGITLEGNYAFDAAEGFIASTGGNLRDSCGDVKYCPVPETSAGWGIWVEAGDREGFGAFWKI